MTTTLRGFELPLLPQHAVGGLIWLLVDPEGTILMSGLARMVAESPPPLQSVFAPGSTSTSTFGFLVWVFYLQGKLREVETVSLVTGVWFGFADSYVWWLAGVPGKAVFKATAGMLAAVVGQGSGNHCTKALILLVTLSSAHWGAVMM